ncbi:FxsA family protein [Sphaerimonospora mesophila]|uniref:FxsA family protein n=1 Tax=Sphaerimonospora mesophila TaxID=37483 RepID=UPI0006E19275
MLRIGLFLAFLALPVLEIWFLIQVGSVIGGWQTVGLLIVAAVLGVWLMRREGRRTWAALQSAIGSGRMPDRELADAALIMGGGAMLLAPGFLSDVFGLFLILPVTRPVARRWLTWFLDRWVRSLAARSPYGPLLDHTGTFGGREGFGPEGFGPEGFGAAGRPGSGNGRVRVVHGEVIDDEGPSDGPKPPARR